MDKDLLPHFAARAMAGDGQFAIAYAVLSLSIEHRRLQENLTFGDGSPDRIPGVLETIAVSLRDIASTMGDDHA